MSEFDNCDHCGEIKSLTIVWDKFLNTEGKTKFQRVGLCKSCKDNLKEAN